jgi:hypothetical protein
LTHALWLGLGLGFFFFGGVLEYFPRSLNGGEDASELGEIRVEIRIQAARCHVQGNHYMPLAAAVPFELRMITLQSHTFCMGVAKDKGPFSVCDHDSTLISNGVAFYILSRILTSGPKITSLFFISIVKGIYLYLYLFPSLPLCSRVFPKYAFREAKRVAFSNVLRAIALSHTGA